MEFDLVYNIAFLFIAGFVGGVLNSIAGGGTFITFPALIFVGIPPISANATNTFASCSGYISGAIAFRKELIEHKKELPKIILISFLGGISGAWLLLNTSEKVFQEIIPWLMLFATVVFSFGTKCNAILQDITASHKHASSIGALLALLLLFSVCTYGGFFNAGLGIITLSYLTITGHTNINAMNGLKLLVSASVSLIAIGLFIFSDAITWHEGSIMLLGTLAGGYIAARISRHVSQSMVRGVVIIISTIITSYFFWDVYAL